MDDKTHHEDNWHVYRSFIMSELLKKNDNYFWADRYLNYLELCYRYNSYKNVSYKENHHILPKDSSLWPEYSCLETNTWNKISLSRRQHITAHWVLAKYLGGSAWLGLRWMIYGGNEVQKSKSVSHSVIPSLKKYDEIYKQHSQRISENNKRFWDDPELRQKRIDSIRKYHKENPESNAGENNPRYGIKTPDYIKRALNKGLQKLKEENPDYNRGQNNSMYGKCHSEETKGKMSISQKLSNLSKVCCIHCKNELAASNLSQFHGDNCKMKLGNENYIIERNKAFKKSCETKKGLSIAAKNRPRGSCLHCRKTMDVSNLSKYHGDNCKFKKGFQHEQ